MKRAPTIAQNSKQPQPGSLPAQLDTASKDATFQFADKRASSAVQRRVQTLAANSPQVERAAQLQAKAAQFAERQPQVIQKKANTTGLPDQLKSGVESLSGISMNDVKVHYNSSKPATLQAHAYAQGTQIHIAPGQEKHLPHEAWHVVQQKQGRVKATMQLKRGIGVNDDRGLEREADVMGAKALQLKPVYQQKPATKKKSLKQVTPAEKLGLEELGGAIQAKFKSIPSANDVVQRAWVGRRPLGGKVSFGLESAFFHNKGVFHAHIFFQDGKAPPNIGFHSGDPKLFQDTPDMLGLYHIVRRGLNDQIMRQAVEEVGDPGTYALLGNNCQAYVERVLHVYDRIESNPSGNKRVYDSVTDDML